MKNAVMVLMSGIIGVLVLVIVMTIGGNMNRRVELQENLSAAVEGALKEEQYEDGAAGQQELIAECLMRLVYAFGSATDLSLQIYQSDVEKEILALQANGSYVQQNGKQGEVSWERVAICEKEEKEAVKECEVSFYWDKDDMLKGEQSYKKYRVAEGERMAVPLEPKKEGMVFVEWRDVNDYMADFSLPVIENRCYYAVWE